MKKLDLSGKKFGSLTVIDEVSPYVSPKGYKKTRWNCVCDCGNDTIVMSSHLTTGHTTSCGCKQFDGLTSPKVNDLVGKKFGLLTVIKQLDNRQIGKNSRVNWLCRCECGNYSEVLGILLTNNRVKSCGCLSISHAERLMDEFLSNYNVIYDIQYTESSLVGVGGGLLRFDYVIYDNQHCIKCLVELNGIQHYEVVEYFGGKSKFEKIRINDSIKQDWCVERDIPLISIDVSKCFSDQSFLQIYQDVMLEYLT